MKILKPTESVKPSVNDEDVEKLSTHSRFISFTSAIGHLYAHNDYLDLNKVLGYRVTEQGIEILERD